jgi:endonuclease/exonuclease/phosphatase family metal-dependent hydrolase
MMNWLNSRYLNKVALWWLAPGFLLALVGPAIALPTEPTSLSVAQMATFTQQPVPSSTLAAADSTLRGIWRYPQTQPNSPVALHHYAHGKKHAFLRVATWNVERGQTLPQFMRWINGPKWVQDPHGQEAAQWLNQADVWLLSEVDLGMGRTGYNAVAQQFGQLRHQHAIFAPEFIELAPFFRESRSDETGHSIDKTRYKGLHGAAIISRFPIIDSRIIRLPICYDWFNGERSKLSELEKLRRTASGALFKEDVYTEVRYGSRMALVATLAVPQVPETGKLTVVALHLENRCTPACRQTQMNAVLAQLKSIRNPIVMGGDWNTTGTDVSPTSVSKELRMRLKEPAFWTKQALSWLTPFGLPLNVGLTSLQYANNLYNPTATHIPLVAPNREQALFDTLKAFRFEDGTTFDFRGDKVHSFKGHPGLLSNSNQRWVKGFVPTFTFNRPLFKGAVGRYKLDWLVVKGFNGVSEDSQDLRFAPQLGRTHSAFNQAAKTLWGQPFSDHDPLTVDIAL